MIGLPRLLGVFVRNWFRLGIFAFAWAFTMHMSDNRERERGRLSQDGCWGWVVIGKRRDRAMVWEVEREVHTSHGSASTCIQTIDLSLKGIF